MEKEIGTALYTIELGGCLTGVYTYNNCDGVILNEIAKRYTPVRKDGLSGNYNSVYFDTDNNSIKAILKIAIVKGKKRTYGFTWKTKRNTYKGVGYKMNEKQVSVQYWESR
jgi:hypothetical protein